MKFIAHLQEYSHDNVDNTAEMEALNGSSEVNGSVSEKNENDEEDSDDTDEDDIVVTIGDIQPASSFNIKQRSGNLLAPTAAAAGDKPKTVLGKLQANISAFCGFHLFCIAFSSQVNSVSKNSKVLAQLAANQQLNIISKQLKINHGESLVRTSPITLTMVLVKKHGDHTVNVKNECDTKVAPVYLDWARIHHKLHSPIIMVCN